MPRINAPTEASRNTEMEFALLDEKHEQYRPELSPQLYQTALKPSNTFKNRYCNILALDSTRVVVPSGDYLNANWVCDSATSPVKFAPQPFILAQAPSLSTMVDFYSCIWTYKVSSVVCLTRLEEGRRTKAHRYWPADTSDTLFLGPWQISMPQEESLLDGSVVRRHIKMTLRKKSDDATAMPDSMEFTLFHFTAWCDHATPAKVEAFVDLIRLVRETATDLSRPIIAHCSAGVGRAGTFVAAYNLRLLKEEGETDITPFDMVDWLRTKRYGAVQTHAQYAFIYRAADCYDETIESDRSLESDSSIDEEDESDFLRTTQWTLSVNAVIVL